VGSVNMSTARSSSTSTVTEKRSGAGRTVDAGVPQRDVQEAASDADRARRRAPTVVASPWTVTPTHGVAAFLATASSQTLITASDRSTTGTTRPRRKCAGQAPIRSPHHPVIRDGGWRLLGRGRRDTRRPLTDAARPARKLHPEQTGKMMMTILD
jgi:hypothetical protein